jgi:hypothetical protein
MLIAINKSVHDKNATPLVFRRADWEKIGCYKQSFLDSMERAIADINAGRVYPFSKLKKMYEKIL